MSPANDGPSPLYLVLGDEELLVDRAVTSVLDVARKVDPTADLSRVKVSDITPAELAELLSPSLFAEGRVVALLGAQEIGKELAEAVAGYVKQPSEGIFLVVVHTGGGRAKHAKELPAQLKKAGARVAECKKLTKPQEREAFVRDEAKRAGGKIDPRAISALTETVGSDLRELASATAQLVADTGGHITEDAVRRYHRGKAEVTGFAVAEKAVTGDRAGALEALRWASHLGVPHVLIADALADAVRTIAKVSHIRGVDPFSVAGELGMPPWKVKKALAQARGWDSGSLATAMQVVADVNADVKGAAASPDYALEHAVLRLIAARQHP
ncbi:DNA polymerase III subunit delta [Pseudonocardiaceae bacterium YIM PH 21723]|nr:DNA polymerase III subunit delta [Pseudonocardiaceae bacterium YIM PH 21723]